MRTLGSTYSRSPKLKKNLMGLRLGMTQKTPIDPTYRLKAIKKR